MPFPDFSTLLKNLRVEQYERFATEERLRRERRRLEKIEAGILFLSFQQRMPDLQIFFEPDHEYEVRLSRDHLPESKIRLEFEPTTEHIEKQLGLHKDYLLLFPSGSPHKERYGDFLQMLDLALALIKGRNNGVEWIFDKKGYLLDFSKPIDWTFWFKDEAIPVRAEVESLFLEVENRADTEVFPSWRIKRI